jgi:hypothetical protein
MVLGVQTRQRRDLLQRFFLGSSNQNVKKKLAPDEQRDTLR